MLVLIPLAVAAIAGTGPRSIIFAIVIFALGVWFFWWGLAPVLRERKRVRDYQFQVLVSLVSGEQHAISVSAADAFSYLQRTFSD